MIEFMGPQRPLTDVWNDDLAPIIRPYRDRIEQAFAAANDPDLLADIEVIFFVDDERTWGVRFHGEPIAVHYATDVVGPLVRMAPRSN